MHDSRPFFCVNASLVLPYNVAGLLPSHVMPDTNLFSAMFFGIHRCYPVSCGIPTSSFSVLEDKVSSHVIPTKMPSRYHLW